MLTKVLIFAIFAMSLNLIWGYTGLISLGHAAFFGVGGYTSAILTIHYGIESFWISGFCGILMAGLFAAVFGIIALRVSGIGYLFPTGYLGPRAIDLLYRHDLAAIDRRFGWHNRDTLSRPWYPLVYMGSNLFLLFRSIRFFYLFFPFISDIKLSLRLFFTGHSRTGIENAFPGLQYLAV
jgi:hypothetical protein